jgi:hypothetical protein
MKKEPHDRGTAWSAPFVRSGDHDEQNSAPYLSVSRQQHGRIRKIFVIKKIIWLGPPNGRHKKIRRILIFDNHPDSLRLVYGRRRHPDVDLLQSKRAGSWELIVVSMVTLVGLIGMFWPLL